MVVEHKLQELYMVLDHTLVLNYGMEQLGQLVLDIVHQEMVTMLVMHQMDYYVVDLLEVVTLTQQKNLQRKQQPQEQLKQLTLIN